MATRSLPAPLTGTTEEGVLANFQPDPKREAKNLLDETIGDVKPDQGSTATPTADQQRDAATQDLQSRAGSAPNSANMGSVYGFGDSLFGKTYEDLTNSQNLGDLFGTKEQFQSARDEYQNIRREMSGEESAPEPRTEARSFMRDAGRVRDMSPKPQRGQYPTFPEYMSQYSPKRPGDFRSFGSNYNQDNQYQYYESYDTPAQFMMDKAQKFAPFALNKFLSSANVPQAQNNFGEAGNFFATRNAQMEQAAKQETQTDKRVRLAGQRGSAASRY